MFEFKRQPLLRYLWITRENYLIPSALVLDSVDCDSNSAASS